MAALNPPPRGAPGCARPDLARRLPEWDQLPAAELEALAAHAAACPRCGPDLAELRRVDAWLADRRARAPVDACPAAEDLYDYARGPGALVLPAALRASIEAHLERCGDCSDLAGTLRSHPPSPLILDVEALETLEEGPGASRPRLAAPSPAAVSGPAQRRPAPLRREAWRALPLALAAGLVLALALWRLWAGDAAAGPDGTVLASVRYPQAPVLRGDQGGLLLFPRDALLARADGAPLSPWVFELEPLEGASSYRCRLWRRGAEPLDEGVLLVEVEDEAPTLALAEDDARALAPGLYTWEAWAEVDGLSVPLGRRDVELRDDAATRAALDELRALDPPLRDERSLALLHERGYLGDARALARTLPASPERDAYLGRAPAR